MGGLLFDEDEPIKRRCGLQGNHSRTAPVLNPFRLIVAQHVARHRGMLDGAIASAGKSIDVPKARPLATQRSRVCAEILLYDRKLEVGRLSAEFVVDDRCYQSDLRGETSKTRSRSRRRPATTRGSCTC